jgi:hypothetical protein
MGIGVRIQQQKVVARHAAENHSLPAVQIVESILGGFAHRGQEWLARIFPQQSQQLPQGKNHPLAAFLLECRKIERGLGRGVPDRLFLLGADRCA